MDCSLLWLWFLARISFFSPFIPFFSLPSFSCTLFFSLSFLRLSLAAFYTWICSQGLNPPLSAAHGKKKMGVKKEKMQEERETKTRKKRTGGKDGVKVKEENREKRKVQSAESFGGREGVEDRGRERVKDRGMERRQGLRKPQGPVSRMLMHCPNKYL